CACGDLSLNQPEFRDRFPECGAFLGVADHMSQRVTGSAHARDSELEAADVQNVKGDVMPFACLAQQIRRRDRATIQNYSASRRTANPKLVLFGSNLQSRRCPLNKER